MSNQTSPPGAEPAQLSPAKQVYQRKPKEEDPRFSQYDMLSPSERQCLQAAALEIGGDCTLISRPVTLPGQGKSLDKPCLPKQKLTGQEGYLLQHTVGDDVRNHFIHGVGWTNGFGTYDSSVAVNRYQHINAESDDKQSEWRSLDSSMLDNPLMRSSQAPPALHIGPQPRYDGKNHIHSANSNDATFNRSTTNGVINNGSNTIGPAAFVPQDTPMMVNPRLLSLKPSVTTRQSFTELPQRPANADVHGNGRIRLPLLASDNVALMQGALRQPHAFTSTHRASCNSQGPQRLFDSIFPQRTTSEKAALKHRDADSSSASGSTFSSPAAQASLRRQNKEQSSHILPPKAEVPCTLSFPFQDPHDPSPLITIPKASSSSSMRHASSPKVPSSSIAPSHILPEANGITLINPREKIPDRLHSVFPYGVFNAVQSKCFNSVYMTGENVIVSAPTGSGKTVLLELAICKLVDRKGSENAKIVYIAPTKALCKEKAEQWRKKFGMMTMPVSELTGDTSRAEMRTVREAKIIVTTPEKWDSITRSWIDHRKLLDLVELFLIDEVHILKESRGATLEAVVSRMKTYGSKVRFIALSATIPNSADIACWLGRDHANPSSPAHREVFGEEFRPVKLQKIVHGIEAKLADHPFDNYLNTQLWKYIEMHTQRKPMLVFCMTRKSCQNAAEELAKQWSQRSPSARLWPQPRKRIPVIDASLQELVRYGVAFHHAGLEPDDRRAVHQAFEEGHLSVICCTSTLAVGVNLPCHTVLLKGTVCYQDGGQLCEYSDLEVMQMLGRAGRPQYENSALAIILTRSGNKKRYEDLGSGQQILESTLHKNLIEHLNSEISLGTFHNVKGAKLWLEGTFLSVRLYQNPRYYSDLTDGKPTSSTRDQETTDIQIGKICESAINNLRDACLIKGDTKNFQHTDYGRAMSKYMVRFETMKMILEIPRGAKTQELLSALCEASEFNEIRWQASERDLFREINRDPFIMYPVEGTVSTVAHKVSLLIQMELGRVELSNINGFERQRLRAEAGRVLDMMHRLIRTVVECKGSDADGLACWAALDLARSMVAKAWEDRPMQLLQIPQVGPALMRKLVSHNIRTVSQLADSYPSNIERIASRNPPFGKKMTDSLAFFPRLTLRTVVKDSKVDADGNPVIYIDAFLGFSNARGKWKGKIPIVTFLAVTTKGISSYFCRESLNAFDQEHNTEHIRFTWAPNSFQETLVCRFACEEIVGTIVCTETHHKLSPSAFPHRLEDKQLPSAEPQRQLPNQMSSASENKVEDEDMLEVLDDFARKGASDKREDFESDIDEDDLFALLDRKGNLERRPPKSPRVAMERGPESSVDKGYQDFDTSASSTRADQQHAGDNTTLPSRASQARKHEAPSQVQDEDATEGEPVRLPNGRYKCGHPCSQAGGGTTARGDKCGHDCCRNGSKHPPRKQNNNGKRKEQTGDGGKPGSLPGPRLFPSSLPSKRAQTNAPKKRKAVSPESTFSATSSRSRLLQRTPALDLSLYDVDEEGIIDLTRDFGAVTDPDPSVLKSGNNGRKQGTATKQTDSTDDMMDNLSDDDLIGIDIALEGTHGGERASTLDENSRRLEKSNKIASLVLLKQIEKKTDDDALVGRQQKASKTTSQDQYSVCDATRRGNNGSMRGPMMANEYSYKGLPSPQIASDETMYKAGSVDEQASFSPAGVNMARPKSQRVLGTPSSIDRAKAAVGGSPAASSLHESIPTRSKQADDPEWVNDFDASLISEFRGLVDFI